MGTAGLHEIVEKLINKVSKNEEEIKRQGKEIDKLKEELVSVRTMKGQT